MKNLKLLKDRFNNHPHSKNVNLDKLDEFQFKALLWALETCRFEITGFSEKDFTRWIYTGTKRALNILNSSITKQEFINV